jgi:malonyl-CoA O-methyltransferase
MSLPGPADPAVAGPAKGGAPRELDLRALARTLQRLRRADEPPWLHAEAARRLGERLPLVKLQPRHVLDDAGWLGASAAVLAQAYPKAVRRSVEADPAARPPPRRRWPFGRSALPALAPHEVLDGQAELLWSNMALHAEPDPVDAFARWHRATAIGGFLMFSTLGPGTLTELGALFAQQGWGVPMAPLVDMHDLGDMLVRAGFADPVMDQETLTLTWPDAAACLAELRALGGNVALRRHPGLRTPRWRGRLLQALSARAGADGRIALRVELVYGHAFRVAPRPRVSAETAVPLDDLRAMVRTAPRRP